MLRRSMRNRAWKGLAGGLVGGLAATIVMSQFQNAWSKASEALQNTQGSDSSKGSGEEGEDATMKAAGKLAAITGHKLTRDEKKKSGSAIHYVFGTAMGAVYGLLREVAPRRVRTLHPLAAGTGYGAALFLSADEAVVPALGLSGAPQDSPVGSHLYGLASHLVYGVTLEMVRRGVRKAL